MSVSRHTAYNLAGALIPLALSFMTVPLYLHLVGPDRYGVLAIAWLLLGYFGLFDLGLGRATSFRMASLKSGAASERADVFCTALGINAGIGVFGGAILWLAGYWFFGSVFKVDAALRAETLAGLPWLAASVPVATMTGVLTGALQGREKFLETNAVSVISTVLFQLLPLGVAWYHGPDLAWLLAAAVLARVAAIGALWRSCRREFLAGQAARWQKHQARTLLAFGGWVTMNGLMGPLLIMADRFLIGAVLNAHAVAIYTIPFQLAQRSGVIPVALSGALFPRLTASSSAARGEILDKAIRALAALTTVPVYIALFLFEPFLQAWVGSEMAQSAYRIGMIVIIAFWANSFVAIYYTFFQAAGRPSIVTGIVSVQVIPYLLLLWFALKEWGLEGAAWLFAARAGITFFAIFAAQRHSLQTRLVILVGGMGLWAGYILASAGAFADLPYSIASLIILVALARIGLGMLIRDFPEVYGKFRLLRS